MKTNEITPLTQLESGQLTGGFISTGGKPDDQDAFVNGNCSETSGTLNYNCGCNKCSPGKDKPETGNV